MNTSELLEQIRNILSSDADLNAWCNDQFSKNPTIYLGIDSYGPEPVDEYPIVGLENLQRTGKTWDLVFACKLIQPAFDIDGQTKTYRGLLQAERLAELVEESLLNARFAKITGSGESADIRNYPKFVGKITLTVEQIISKRRR